MTAGAPYGAPSGAPQIQDDTPTYDQSQMSLTPELIKRLAECIIAGCTRQETADALGKSPRTVSRWKTDPRVLAEVERLRNRPTEIRVEDVLQHLLESDDEHIRLMAVRETLRWEIQRAPVEPEPEPAVEEGYIVVRRKPFR